MSWAFHGFLLDQYIDALLLQFQLLPIPVCAEHQCKAGNSTARFRATDDSDGKGKTPFSSRPHKATPSPPRLPNIHPKFPMVAG